MSIHFYAFYILKVAFFATQISVAFYKSISYHYYSYPVYGCIMKKPVLSNQGANYTPTNCVCGRVYCFHVHPSGRACVCVCVSVAFCFLNILKNH